MDCHSILRLLTDCSNCGNDVVKDETLSNVLSRIFSGIPINIFDEIVQDRNTTSDSNDTGWHYLHLLLYTLKKLSCTEFADENVIFTVEQYRTIKAAIASSASIGIVPSLLPQIKAHLIMVRASKSATFRLNLDGDGIMEKYKRLSHTTTIFLELCEKSIFQAAVMAQLDCLLAGLLQLAHAPLKKPIDDSTSVLTTDFEMTPQLYLCLKNEQSNFHIKLQTLVQNYSQSKLVKDLMVLLSIKNVPKWLQLNIKRHLAKRIMLPGGILALALAVCDEVSDLGKCWNKLDVTAKLVARSHGIADTEEYHTSVCSQILTLLNSKENKQSIIIAKACTTALYDYNSQVCIEKIINTIMEPLLVKYGSNSKNSAVVRTEDQVSCSIQNLCQLFTTDAEFRCLPSTLLLPISLPLFYLHIKSYQSIYVLRNQVRQLILKVLQDEATSRETLFAIFLNHEIADYSKYGEKLNFLFGTDGALEISSERATIEYEELTDCMFNLVDKDSDVVFSLFRYLLKVLPKMNNVTASVNKGKLLESPEDVQERIVKQIFAVKLLTLCSSSSLVQQAQVNEPEPFLDFIKFFFSKTIADFNDTCAYEQDASILYTSLLFVKMILTDCDVCKSWSIFQDFTLSVKREFNFKKVPAHVVSLIEEIESLVKKKGKSKMNYYDLSADGRKMNEFDKAINDLADPLLPVRGHGIITLTKLIESRHPETTLKKDLILCIFQENLNHEDSFIYLAAINGLCALSSMIPEQVLEILVHEFIGLTQSKNRDVTPETRAKLGEILVKTTRALGEVTPKYKSLLVNGFLCGARDPDPLVRASSLSCMGEFCKIMGFRLGNLIIEILYCVGCIIKTDKDDTCRRAGVLVATLLLRGLGKDALAELGVNLVTLYRSLKHLRDTDKDPVLQLHARLALEEFDDIVRECLFAKPRLAKSIFLLSI